MILKGLSSHCYYYDKGGSMTCHVENDGHSKKQLVVDDDSNIQRVVLQTEATTLLGDTTSQP